jgi:alternate signal-mediated exported protein
MTTTRSRRVKGLIAGAAGAALLLGGTTFALWSDSDQFPGAAAITAGDLDITVGAPSVYDWSTNGETWNGGTRGDQGDDLSGWVAGVPAGAFANVHRIADPSTYRQVPADRNVVAYPFTVTLVGDNLVADLRIPATAGFNVTAAGVPAKYQGLKAIEIHAYVDGQEATLAKSTYTWTELIAAEAAAAPIPIATLQAPNTGQDDGTTDPGITTLSSGTVNGVITVVINIPNYTERDSVTETILATTSTFGLELAQTRAAGTGWF